MSSTTQRRSRLQHGYCIGVSRRSAQATAGKGLAQGPYIAVRAGVEPTTLRLRVIASTNAPPSYLRDLGLKELWQQYGTGEKRRMLPLHQAACQLGPSLAKTVIKTHILTGVDCMSKVGSKHAVMACDPVNYMTNFGETEQDTELAEKCLVCVWAGTRSTTTCETFDQFRAESYLTQTVGIDALPHTSGEIG